MEVLRKGTDLLRKQPIVFKEKKVLTTELLAEIYGTSTDNIKVNFNNHKSNFKEGKHYYLLKGDELREFKNQVNDIYPVGKRASSLYLWTERGANRHCKILDTDKAWEQFDNLEETYFRVKDGQDTLEGLSPQLQALINMELEQKKIKQQLNEVNHHALEAKSEAIKSREEIQAMRNVVAINSNDWKNDCKKLITKIAYELGGIGHINDVYREVYSTLDRRMKTKLSVRLTNKRRRMADEGVCKSKRDKLNYINVIEDDCKLIEGYVAIVKELAIKYGVA